MKSMKKILAMALAVVMIMSLATTVFANGTEGGTTTYNYQYEIFQIFTGKFEENVLTDVKWGEDAKLPAGVSVGDAVSSEVLKELEGIEQVATDETKLTTILKYADLSKTKTVMGSNDNPASFTLAKDGYYLVRDKADSQSGENGYYTTYVVQVVDNTLSITRKGTVPRVDKYILDSTQVKENEASIGEDVNYEIVGSLPSNIADYDTYYYVFTDILSKGLTLKDMDDATDGIQNNIKVYIQNGDVTVDVTDYFYRNAAANSENKGTDITVGIKDLIALKLVEDFDDATEGNQSVNSITAATKVVVTYTAVLNADAVVGNNGNPNTVFLRYSNDPNNDGTPASGSNKPSENPEEPKPEETTPGEPSTTTTIPTGVTPKDTVWTYTTELTINKVDAEGNALTGAKFQLTGDSVKKVVITTYKYEADTDGTYYKLKTGAYTTDAPNNNNTDMYESTTVKYKQNAERTSVEVSDSVNVISVVGADGKLKFTGLGAGTYTITELEAPAGYNKLETPIEVTITWAAPTGNSNECTWTYSGTDYTDANNNKQHDEGEPYLPTVTVINQKGSTLPSTGGIGTTLFYVFGGIMVLAAVVLLITKKRMASAE